MRIFSSLTLYSFRGENVERRRKSFRAKIRLGRKEKRGIAEIISTLLMILIAVASAAYSLHICYRTGRRGHDFRGDSSPELLSIDNTCVSVLNRCDGIYGYFVAVRNTGSVLFPEASPKSILQTSQRETLQWQNAPFRQTSPRYCLHLWGPNVVTYSQGQQVTIKVVDADDSRAMNTVRATP